MKPRDDPVVRWRGKPVVSEEQMVLFVMCTVLFVAGIFEGLILSSPNYTRLGALRQAFCTLLAFTTAIWTGYAIFTIHSRRGKQ